MSNPGQFPDCPLKVSNPESRHQKLQEDWMGTQGISISLCLLSLFTGIPLLGAAGRNPGHSTKNCKRIG